MQPQILKADFKNDHFSSADYLKKSAKSKMVDLWSMITSTQGVSASPPSNIAGAFVESMKPTMEAPGDAMPKAMWGFRTKYIHAVGVVGKVKFVSDRNNAYTGIFKGADTGLIRLSSAATPSASQPLAPGFGLKFLRDGRDSANLVAMYDLEGQPNDWNFFSHAFTNHVQPKSSAVITIGSAKFATATKYVTEVGLGDFAQYTSSGAQEAQKNYPFELKFEPHKSVSNKFSKDLGDKNYGKFTDQLVTVPANSVLYNVYALDKPTELNGSWKKIGALQLDGGLVKSEWADKQLFFRHGYMDYDLNEHSDWTKYTPKFCPFGFGSK